MVKTFGFSVIFAFVYMLITLNLGEKVGQDTITQLNFGLMIGVLIWIAIEITNKFD